ncbi:MAG: hypothetical protein JWM47_4519 [Acidimicrobiales bacterium]|nr:hypothetical protein [Acidimicrobiales bacterium]
MRDGHSDTGDRARRVLAEHGIPAGIDHDRDQETVEVGVVRKDDRGVTWQLRVCGVVHGQGIAESASHALIDAGFYLRDHAKREQDRP